MALTKTPMTELEAVNLMLYAIGERPVSTLNDSGIMEAVTARQVLHNMSRLVQDNGWSFNEEKDYPLVRDVNGHIYLPSNTLKVDPTDATDDFIQRGNRLYDKGNHTFVFTKDVKVDIVFFLPFEELPQYARTYITYRAAQEFQANVIGSIDLSNFIKEGVGLSWITFLSSESRNADYNIFNNTATQRVVNRGRNPVMLR